MTDVKEKEIGLVDFDPKKDQVIDLWYQDAIEFAHGISLRIKIKNVLYNTRSAYQEITIMETEKLGRILVIDGITMLTEWDEHAYHEMISHGSAPRPPQSFQDIDHRGWRWGHCPGGDQTPKRRIDPCMRTG